MGELRYVNVLWIADDDEGPRLEDHQARVNATTNIASEADSPCFAYSAYGLRVQSLFALPFRPLDALATDDVDVRIRLGATPA